MTGTAISSTLGTIKYNEFAGEFKEKYGEVIISQTNYARSYLKQDDSSKMLYKALAKIWHLSQSNLAMDELVQAGFVDTNNNIDYSKCNNIGNYDASIFQAIDRESLIKVCNEIYQAYLNYSNSLEKTIAQNLNSAMTNTLKQDVAKPILMQAGYFLYNEFSNWFDNLKQKNTKEKEDSSSGDNDPELANDNDGGEDKDNKKGKDLKDNEAKKTVFKLVKETNEPEVIIGEAKGSEQKANKIADNFDRIEQRLSNQNLESSNTADKPTIEVIIRDVIPEIKIFGWTIIPAQKHIFTIFTDSNGYKIIIAGFPEDSNMVIGNLKVIDAPYTEGNKDLFGKDFARKGNYKDDNRFTIISKKTLNNEQELQSYLEKAREEIKSIEQGNNGKRFDYDICITKKCWGSNSNTVQQKIHNAMGLEIKIPKGTNVPGIKGKFYDGPLDDLARKHGEELNKEQP